MLSYNWADQELVQGLHDVIKGHGLPVWMDIKGGIVGQWKVSQTPPSVLIFEL